MAKIRIEKLDREVKRLQELNKKPKMYASDMKDPNEAPDKDMTMVKDKVEAVKSEINILKEQIDELQLQVDILKEEIQLASFTNKPMQPAASEMKMATNFLGDTGSFMGSKTFTKFINPSGYFTNKQRSQTRQEMFKVMDQKRAAEAQEYAIRSTVRHLERQKERANKTYRDLSQ